jgi:hypothetical protein
VFADNWWFYTFGLGSLCVLAVLEHRQKVPLPFMNHLTTKDFLKTFALAFVLPIPINVVTVFAGLGMMMALGTEIGTLTSFICYNLAWNANVGIVEESLKVLATNGVVAFLLWVLSKRRSEKADKAVLYVVGSGLVAVWAWAHIYVWHYPIRLVLPTFLGIFLGGMVYLVLIIRKRNYLPIVFAHMAYDDLLIFLPLLFYQFSLIM